MPRGEREGRWAGDYLSGGGEGYFSAGICGGKGK
jgi:hypothetical protein